MMFKKPCQYVILFSLAAVCRAQELPQPDPESTSALDPAPLLQVPEISQWIQELSSEDYQVRFEAREKLQVLFADATRPETDAEYLNGLEIQLLAELSKEANPSARLWIIQLIEWFGGDLSGDEISVTYPASEGEERDAIRRALAANPSTHAATGLRTALAAASDEEKVAIINALGRQGNLDGIYSVGSLLGSQDPAVVNAAAHALAKVRFPMFFDAMVAARNRAAASNRPSLESAILSIGVSPDIVKGFVHDGATPSIRVLAFKQLVSQGQPAEWAALNEVIDDTEFPGRREMLRVVMESRDHTMIMNVVARLPGLGGGDQQVILAAIADKELREHEGAVLALLPEVSGMVRESAFRTLGVIGGEASADPLVEAYLQAPSDVVAGALARLQVPSLDARLFTDLAEAVDGEKRMATVKLLALRNPEGTVDRFNEFTGSVEDEALMSELYKALESVGNLESCKLLAAAVVGQSAWTRPAQQSLKKLSLNLSVPDVLWETVYQPALQSAASDQGREDLLVILDGIAGAKSLAYLEGLVVEPAHPLRAVAIRSLARWPDFAAGEVWMKMAKDGNSSAEDLVMARNGLIRIITQKSVAANHNQKYELAVKAIQQGPTPEYKAAILARCEVPKNRQKQHFEKAFSKLLDDPDVGPQVSVLLGKTPAPAATPASAQ